MLQQALTTTSLLRRLENLEAEIERLQAENARLQAVISTCRKQERNVYAFLRALFAYQPVSLLAG